VSSDAGGVLNFGVAWQHSQTIAKEVVLPISALLARIRKLVPRHKDRHYDEIVRGFGVGELRPPVSHERRRTQPGDCRFSPSSEAVSSLGRRFNPSSGV
jgi:hypothetical protein